MQRRGVLGLTLVGNARALTSGRLAAAAGDRLEVFPGPYVTLMTEWGPGRLCDVFDLPDPTEPAGRFRYLQQRLRVDGAARRLAGAWAALSDDELRRGWVLGVDRRGFALFARSATSLALLHPSGHVLDLGTFEELVARFLLGGRLVLTDRVRFEDDGRAWRWASGSGGFRGGNDLGVPATYRTDAPPPRATLMAAWAEGDEAAADAALARVLEAEVAGYALLELLCYLASPEAAGVPAETRATYADQLYRTARRRIPNLVPDLPIREIRIALERGELAPELRARVAAMLEGPESIFLGEPDAAELALLEALASQPSDDATRAVYADHLEERGELARAEALRAEAGVAPLPDAAERGFVAPLDLPPVDGAARIRERIAQWAAEDPAFSLEAATAHIEALHPVARQGYEMLFAMLTGPARWGASYQPAQGRTHLLREIGQAWPQLALALRSREAWSALDLLRAGRVRDAAPFLLSLLRHSATGVADWQLHVADVYLELGRVTKELCEELVPYLAADAVVQPRHSGVSVPVQRAVAFRLLGDFGADDRVFEGALRFFCEAHPHSERIVRKRKTDPRVRRVLGEQLAAEEKKSLHDGGRILRYTPELGLLARYLARLGDEHAKEVADRYRKYRRVFDRQERDRYDM